MNREIGDVLNDIVEMDKFCADKAFISVQSKIEKSKRNATKRRVIYMSAAVSSIAAAIMLFMYLLPVTIVNNSFSPLSINLPDGTEVVLKSGSEINYSRTFVNDRNVELKGEAFFDVARDVNNPFVINVGKSRVRVLGTSFNVKHIEKSNDVEVFVKTGKVLLENELKESVQLGANEYAIADKKKVKKLDAVDKNYLAWKNRRFEFNNDELSYVLNSLGDVYSCKYIIADSSLDSLRISTTFYQLTEDEVAESISLTLNLSFKKTSDGYVFANK